MAIEFACACGKKLKAADEHAGKRAKCSGCGQVMNIPSVSKPATVAVAPPSRPKQVATYQKTPSNAAAQKTSSGNIDNLLDNEIFGLQSPRSPQPQAVPANPQTFSTRSCPECRKPLPEKGILCVNCGYNLTTGQKMKQAPQVVVEDEPIREKKPSKVAKFFTDRICSGKVWSGLGLMAGATIWFFVGFASGIIFFYPPVLFFFGIITVLAGIIDGAKEDDIF
jgi:hypothetical protein